MSGVHPRRSLEVEIGPDLAFRFENLPAPFIERIGDFLRLAGRPVAKGPTDPIAVRVQPPPDGSDADPVLLEVSPLRVRRRGDRLRFELPGLVVWADTAASIAGMDGPLPPGKTLDDFAGLILAPLLIELAAPRGWIGLHAAAITVDDRGILLPGASGAGKSTIARTARNAGHGLLSEDLVWLRTAADGVRMVAFPRADRGEPAASANDVRIAAVVVPEIAARRQSRLSPLPPERVLEALLDQGGFLAMGASCARRFGLLVELARAVPGYRLEAGSLRSGSLPPLEALATGLAASETPSATAPVTGPGRVSKLLGP